MQVDRTLQFLKEARAEAAAMRGESPPGSVSATLPDRAYRLGIESGEKLEDHYLQMYRLTRIFKTLEERREFEDLLEELLLKVPIVSEDFDALQASLKDLSWRPSWLECECEARRSLEATRVLDRELNREFLDPWDPAAPHTLSDFIAWMNRALRYLQEARAKADEVRAEWLSGSGEETLSEFEYRRMILADREYRQGIEFGEKLADHLNQMQKLLTLIHPLETSEERLEYEKMLYNLDTLESDTLLSSLRDRSSLPSWLECECDSAPRTRGDSR